MISDRLWIGTWSMAGDGYGFTDARLARHALHTAYDNGVRCFDTASFYGNGRSEALLRSVFSNCDNVLFSAKGGLLWDGRNALHDARPKILRDHCWRSLDALGIDRLFCFFLHWPDPSVDIRDSVEMLRRLHQDGLCHHWGVCHFTIEQLNMIGPVDGMYHQIPFNPLRRPLEVLKQSKQLGWRTVAISPFEHGYLLRSMISLGKRDHRRRHSLFGDAHADRLLTHFRQSLGHDDMSLEAKILQWVLAQKNVDSVLPGPRNIDQCRRLFKGLDTDIKCTGLMNKKWYKKISMFDTKLLNLQ